MLNDLACLRTPTMSTAGVSGVASLGDSGSEGTSGLGAAAGVVGVGWGGFRGEAAGDNWAKVVVKYKNETSNASEKEKRDCFCILILRSSSIKEYKALEVQSALQLSPS
ncbi:unnamed protein product [Sphenostylis stenocarpa]|uniref:Uncharacterized protein n=1 Tax=Sphenostylis stenocarpa TaxID=92480 RepID=A0AA86W6H8_9FABA|nr:unnamed protein product [Sphenostylis stenocarpa]